MVRDDISHKQFSMFFQYLLSNGITLETVLKKCPNVQFLYHQICVQFSKCAQTIVTSDLFSLFSYVIFFMSIFEWLYNYTILYSIYSIFWINYIFHGYRLFNSLYKKKIFFNDKTRVCFQKCNTKKKWVVLRTSN